MNLWEYVDTALLTLTAREGLLHKVRRMVYRAYANTPNIATHTNCRQRYMSRPVNNLHLTS